MKILIADDDPDDRKLSLIAFKELKTADTINFVENGQELIDHLNSLLTNKSKLPDVILLDLNMPKKDGRVALKEIKADPKLKHLDIIIFSTSTSDEDKKYTLALGAKSYVVKPSDYNELVWILKKISKEAVA